MSSGSRTSTDGMVSRDLMQFRRLKDYEYIGSCIFKWIKDHQDCLAGGSGGLGTTWVYIRHECKVLY